jgi:predicted RNase H-like HicB family nuclease
MTCRVVLLPSKEGFAVSCPGLPGCWSQGTSAQEALENIREAIREYLEAVTDLGGRATICDAREDTP